MNYLNNYLYFFWKGDIMFGLFRGKSKEKYLIRKMRWDKCPECGNKKVLILGPDGGGKDPDDRVECKSCGHRFTYYGTYT